MKKRRRGENPRRRKLRVGVLFGGRSGEHEVSLVSAASVLEGLDPKKYTAIPIGITKEGRWLQPRLPKNKLTHADLRKALRGATPVRLDAGSAQPSLVPLWSSRRQRNRLQLDVIFPVLHGTFGEDGTMQGLLELAGIPYVGAGVLASAVGMDKEMQKRLFEQAGLPVVPCLSVPRKAWEQQRNKVLTTIRRRLRFPLFVKPATLGSSIGISKAGTVRELAKALDHAAEFAQKILVERAVNAREIEISVLGNEEPVASLPGEVMPRRDFYDYTAKYLEDSTDFAIPARLTARQARRVQELAVSAYRAIECEGMARVDFLLERHSGKFFLNELNTIPGFTAISMYPKLWEVSGLPYPRLLDRLIQLALERQREKKRTRYSIELPRKRGGVLEE